MRVSDLYYWELETSDGVVYKQWSPDGKNECKWKDVKDLNKIVRASLIPKISALPRHDCIIDISKGERFIRRFGRGFMKMREGLELKRYLNCIVTNRYRLWVWPNGRCMITPPDRELKL